MTQAINLANFANSLDSSGGVPPTQLNAVVPVSKGGTGAATTATAPFAIKGANSDITSLSGLTTALSLSQGGTNATSAADARIALGLQIGVDVLSPTGSGANLTSLDAGSISTGTLAKARLPSGTVLQVVQTVLSTSFSSSTRGSYIPITGLSVNITPLSTSSKILVLCQIMIADNNNWPEGFHIYRNGSVVTPTGPTTSLTPNNTYAAAGGGNAINAGMYGPVLMNYLDSPASTSTLTYQVYGAKPSASSANLVVNPTTAGGSNSMGGSSSIIVMEVAG